MKLTGELSKGEFETFCQNIAEEERRKRIGFDATFSAPKSVSLALAESDERREEIIRIHQIGANFSKRSTGGDGEASACEIGQVGEREEPQGCLCYHRGEYPTGAPMGAKVCAKCGAELAEGQKFCGKCGSKAEQ